MPAVRRTIINDDEFEMRIVLSQHALDRFVHIVSHVIHRHHNANDSQSPLAGP